LNSSNIPNDITARQQCESYYGQDKWFAGHRNGAAGLTNPNTADINSMSCSPLIRRENQLRLTNADYKNAVFWIQKQIESKSKYKTDDTRFWVDVVAI
jgi:hypothetical protein